MNHRISILGLVLPAILALGCQGQPVSAGSVQSAAADAETPPAPDASDAAAGPVLQTYAVPAGHAESARMALRQVLHGEPPIGSVSRDGDQLVVVAPPGIHRGIPAFLKSLETAQSEVDRGSVEVDYWLVVGTPSQDAPDVEAFGELGATLDEIVKSQGPMRFRVLEQLTLSSVIGDSGESRGSIGRVRQQVDLAGDRILIDADVQFHDGGHIGLNNTGLKTRYTLRPGQIGVMARSGYDENPERGGADKGVPGATLFYVVRARLLQDPK